MLLISTMSQWRPISAIISNIIGKTRNQSKFHRSKEYNAIRVNVYIVKKEYHLPWKKVWFAPAVWYDNRREHKRWIEEARIYRRGRHTPRRPF
uniref:39S ribosomal protein L35, mitochondrial n=1 Tax=Ascaris lumbricoides TaxID=6252 RepID=A0A0M3HLG8_ASCLU